MTFTPRINRTGARRGAAEPASASARLYHDAVEQRKRRAARREQLEKESQPTFSPHITQRGSRVRREDGEDVGERLFRTADEIRRHREKHARAVTEAECPFRPSINPARGKARAARPGTAFDRLYDPEPTRRRNSPARNLGGEAASVREVRSARAARKEAPAGASPEAAGERLHARWSASLRRRADAKAAEERAETAGLTFRPQMSSWSRRWARGSHGASVPAHERLFGAAEERRRRLEEAARLKADAEVAGLTFRPAVGEVSRALAEDARRDAAAGGTAFSRLYEEGLLRQQQRALDRFNAGGDVAPPRPGTAGAAPRGPGPGPGDVPVHERLYQNARVRMAGREGAWDESVEEALLGAEALLAAEPAAAWGDEAGGAPPGRGEPGPESALGCAPVPRDEGGHSSEEGEGGLFLL